MIRWYILVAHQEMGVTCWLGWNSAHSFLAHVRRGVAPFGQKQLNGVVQTGRDDRRRRRRTNNINQHGVIL